MNKIYQRFLQTGIDLAPVGVECRKNNTPYFCTPKGASIFGWAGVDGIHFCFIRGFGGMIFSVSPMNTAHHYVHPLANDFADFLRLILACGSETALEQAWMWDEAQFEAFLRENPAIPEQRQTLAEISEKMKLRPMERPWAYIRALQSSFDYSKIPYTEDYYDTDMNPAAELTPPEWKVYFGGNFWVHQGRDHAGKEIRIDKDFDWAGYHWVVPAVYSCSKGLVVDFCMRVDAAKIRSFIKKWNLTTENDSHKNLTQDQQLQMEWENPLCFHFTPCLKLNGKELRATHGCAISFNPCFGDQEKQKSEIKWVMEHYGLAPAYGWVICRNAFPWKNKSCSEIASLSLTMEQQPRRLPGLRFRVHAPGDCFTFSHPISGESYTLTVQELESQKVPESSFGSDRWAYPTHCTAMSYTLSPEPAEDIAIFDCDEGDRPVEIAPKEDPLHSVASSACCVAIIGSADGPVAFTFGEGPQKRLRTAYSALHFEPVQDDVEWRIIFIVKQFDGDVIFLI